MDFSYTALDTAGARVQEHLQADNEDQALRRLHSMGYVVLSLVAARTRPASSGNGLSLRFGARLKLDQVAMLTRELAIMIETGVPVTEALHLLQEHTENPVLNRALAATHTDLAEGKTISQAFAAHPGVFPKLYVDMVRTAETGGSLDETLNQASDYLEAALEMRRKVMGAITYPAILMVVAVAVVIFMVTYVVPQFSQLFSRMGVEVPFATRVLVALSTVTRAYWYLIPVVLIGGIGGTRALLRTTPGRLLLTQALHRTPVIGDTAKKIAMSRVLRSLSTLLKSGVPLLAALETAAQTSQNVIFERAIASMREQVEEGASLSQAAILTGAFPAMLCQMLAVGEKSGRMSDVLLKVGLFYEREVDARLKTLTSVLEPVMIVTLGLVVGFIAISIITPIYSLMGGVK